MTYPVRFKLDPTVDGLELVRQWMDAGLEVGGFLQRLGARPVEAREGFVRFLLDVDVGHLNLMGIVHGGVTAAIVDMAGASAVMTVLTPGQTLATTDLTTRFLNAAPGGAKQLEATGTLTYRDDRKATVAVQVATDTGVVVAQGSVGVAIRAPR
ncbi:PaaI family thioesterase [Brevundimonas staleyi]|uniref:PaaI family thioesterase n=1 Tax=Brevundimonas staleyi TaxID=74326 RepID=A0ABW0FLK1_9CAUL